MTKTLETLSKLLISFGLGLLIYSSYCYYNGSNFDNYSKFGDSIGGLVGSLWSLAGILLFYLALTEQRKDIKINQETLKSQIKSLDLQIDEYKLQRLELEETRKVLKDQSETFRIQQFESTFFNMLMADKMFTATDVTTFQSISLQCNSEFIDELRAKYSAITKHKYFSERHWNLIFLDNSIPDKILFEWIDNSYGLTITKLTKKVRTNLGL